MCLKDNITNVRCEGHCMSSKYCIGYNYVTSLKKCMLIPSVHSCIRDFSLLDANLACSRDDLEPYVVSEMHRCSIKKECKINKKSIKNFINFNIIFIMNQSIKDEITVTYFHGSLSK